MARGQAARPVAAAHDPPRAYDPLTAPTWPGLQSASRTSPVRTVGHPRGRAGLR